MSTMTTPILDKVSVDSDNSETKQQGTFCICKSTFLTVFATALWVLFMASNDCWTDCKDIATKASILGFGFFILFMIGVERLFMPDETLCESLEAMDKDFAKVKTFVGKFGYLVFNMTVFATLIAELNTLLDPKTEMWYREQALYMYGFLMYSNAAGAKFWSVVHTLIFALYSDTIALADCSQIFMNPRTLGLILGYCGIAYEVVTQREDDAVLKEHLPVRSISFFPLIFVPAISAVNGWFEGTSVINYLIIGICILYCSLEMPLDEKRSDASWMERFGAHLYQASIWTHIALALLESMEGNAGTRTLWIIGFLLYAHIGSFEIINVCFVWGITILGALNNCWYAQVHLPLNTTVAVVRTVVLILALADHYLYPKKKSDDEEDASKVQTHNGTKVLLEGGDATEYVPLVDAA